MHHAGTDKSGGDIFQANVGSQDNFSEQDVNAVGPGGAGILEGRGGDGFASAFGDQYVEQYLDQRNDATSGDGGDDNVHADTNIFIG